MPNTLGVAVARVRRQAWHAALAECGDLIGRIGRADTMDMPGVRDLYRDAFTRAHGAPRPPYPAPAPTTPAMLAADLLRDVPGGLTLTCWAVQGERVVARRADRHGRPERSRHARRAAARRHARLLGHLDAVSGPPGRERPFRPAPPTVFTVT